MKSTPFSESHNCDHRRIYPLGEKTPSLGKEVFIAPGAMVIGEVHLGDRVSVWFQSVIRGDVNPIFIGEETNIQDLSCLHSTGGLYPLIIGKGCTIGHRVMLHGCTIEDECLIGMGATILDGTTLGKNCLVGAGALILQNQKFPPGSLILGSPAKRVRSLKDSEINSLLQSRDNYLANRELYLNQLKKETNLDE